MFKALTGEDFITAERKNKDPFSFRPYARFLFSCNEIPRNYGDKSEGFYRRLIIIRFEKSVPKGRLTGSKRYPKISCTRAISSSPNMLCRYATNCGPANMDAFYATSSFFFYQDGVYREAEDMAAAARDVPSAMLGQAKPFSAMALQVIGLVPLFKKCCIFSCVSAALYFGYRADSSWMARSPYRKGLRPILAGIRPA